MFDSHPIPSPLVLSYILALFGKQHQVSFVSHDLKNQTWRMRSKSRSSSALSKSSSMATTTRPSFESSAPLLLSQVDGWNYWLKHGWLGHHCVCQMAISKVYASAYQDTSCWTFTFTDCWQQNSPNSHDTNTNPTTPCMDVWEELEFRELLMYPNISKKWHLLKLHFGLIALKMHTIMQRKVHTKEQVLVNLKSSRLAIKSSLCNTGQLAQCTCNAYIYNEMHTCTRDCFETLPRPQHSNSRLHCGLGLGIHLHIQTVCGGFCDIARCQSLWFSFWPMICSARACQG